MSDDAFFGLVLFQFLGGIISVACVVGMLGDHGWKGPKYANAKFVMGVLAFVFASVIIPLGIAALIGCGLFYGAMAFGSGVRDIYRMVRPKRVKLPEARIHVK